MVTPAAAADQPVVVTTDGPVRGVTEGGLHVFRGIPYAAPPIGDNRFKAPKPVAAWTEPLAAAEFGPACPQPEDPIELAPGDPVSEDCLTLNVWTPADNGKHPVIVFVPGGGFVGGTTRNPWYDGARLAEHGVTVVTLQYRVGPFGWLDLSALGDNYAGSMNNGLRDQITALKWVRKNVGGFGGDPRNVTVVGESAGAISLSALMGAPSADGLYDRLILQSGTTGTVATREWSESVSAEFTRLADVSSAQDLLGLNTDQMLAAAEKLYDSRFADTAFHPVIDGRLIPQPPSERVAAADGPAVPVIIGTNLDEARYWLYYVPELNKLPRSFYEPWLTSLVGDRADSVWQAYSNERPELTEPQIGMALAGDVGFRMPAIRMAEALSARGVDTRMYLATVPAIALDGEMGSPHAVELPFVFNTLAAADDFVADDAQNQQLADQVQNLWVAFARGDLRDWPRYDSTTRSTLMLDTGLAIQNDPYPQSRTAWGDEPAFNGLDPGLDRLTPLQYEGTNYYTPAVLIAVIGWPRILGAALLVVAVIAGIVLLVKRRKRRHAPAPTG